MHVAFRILANALVLLGVAYFLPGFFVADFKTALIVAIVLGILNVFFKPIITILTLPINILTLGLFTFVINGVLIWYTAKLVTGFDIDTFLTAVLGALIFSAVSYLGHKVVIDTISKHKA